MSASTIREWLNLLNQPLDDIKATFNILPGHITTNTTYGKQSGLTELYNADTMPGRLYLEATSPVLLYISNPPGVTLDDFDDLLEGAEPDDMLNSRAGKTSRQHIFTAAGIAYSFNMPEDKIDFVEVFKPGTSLIDYKTRFYIEPGGFSR